MSYASPSLAWYRSVNPGVAKSYSCRHTTAGARERMQSVMRVCRSSQGIASSGMQMRAEGASTLNWHSRKGWCPVQCRAEASPNMVAARRRGRARRPAVRRDGDSSTPVLGGGVDSEHLPGLGAGGGAGRLLGTSTGGGSTGRGGGSIATTAATAAAALPLTHHIKIPPS